MTDKRLAEISESACIRHAALTQVPSKFDPRVKECNDEIGELIDHCLSQRFRANNFQSRLASAESRIAELESENRELRKDKGRLKLIERWLAGNTPEDIAAYSRFKYLFNDGYGDEIKDVIDKVVADMNFPTEDQPANG